LRRRRAPCRFSDLMSIVLSIRQSLKRTIFALPGYIGRLPVLFNFAHAPIGFKPTTRGLLHQRIPYASFATRSVANNDASVDTSTAIKHHRFFDLRVDDVFEHVIGHGGVPVVTTFLRRLDVIDDGDVVESITPQSVASSGINERGTRVDVSVKLRSGTTTLVEMQLRRHMFVAHRAIVYASEEYIKQWNQHVQNTSLASFEAANDRDKPPYNPHSPTDHQSANLLLKDQGVPVGKSDRGNAFFIGKPVRVVIITAFDLFPQDDKHDLVVHLASDVDRRINVAEDLKGDAGPSKRLVNSFQEYTQMTIVQLPRRIPDLSVDPKAAKEASPGLKLLSVLRHMHSWDILPDWLKGEPDLLAMVKSAEIKTVQQVSPGVFDKLVAAQQTAIKYEADLAAGIDYGLAEKKEELAAERAAKEVALAEVERLKKQLADKA
jgi:hypothetical protein